MDSEYLKVKFPNHKIVNISNKTANQISEICFERGSEKNTILFMERNSKNEKYFKFVESKRKPETGAIKYLLVAENTYAVAKQKNYDSYILHLQRLFNNENSCPICFEEDLEEYLYCGQCATICCLSCFDKLENNICSICRHETFCIQRNSII